MSEIRRKIIQRESFRGVAAELKDEFIQKDFDESGLKTLLRQRVAKPAVIKRAHIHELMSLKPIYSERDWPRLQSFYDAIETHFRGLEAHGVDSCSYSCIVVPALLDKLPESLRISMVELDTGIVRVSNKNLKEKSYVVEDIRKTIHCVFFCLLANVDGQSANVHFMSLRSLQQFGRSILGKVTRCDEREGATNIFVMLSPQYTLVILCPGSSWKVLIGLLRKFDETVEL
eukprot:gene8171-14100_t